MSEQFKFESGVYEVRSTKNSLNLDAATRQSILVYVPYHDTDSPFRERNQEWEIFVKEIKGNELAVKIRSRYTKLFLVVSDVGIPVNKDPHHLESTAKETAANIILKIESQSEGKDGNLETRVNMFFGPDASLAMVEGQHTGDHVLLQAIVPTEARWVLVPVAHPVEDE